MPAAATAPAAAQTQVPAPAADAPAASADAPKQRRARATASARGGSIKLAPGSLADPVTEPAAPAQAPESADQATEPSEPAQAVFTQDPILPQRAEGERAARAPRKRGGGKKAVAAAGPSQPRAKRVTSALPEEQPPTQPAILDSMNHGPVANRRRTQI